MTDMATKPSLLAVKGLRVSFTTRGGTVQAIEDVSFDVKRGEMLGIVGESGSGKSVASYAVLRILDRAGRVDDGEVVYGGVDLRAAFGDPPARPGVAGAVLRTLLPDVDDPRLGALLSEAAARSDDVDEALATCTALALTAPEYHLI